MGINKIVFGVSAALVFITGIVFLIFKEKQDEFAARFTTDIVIEETWELPKILREVSGIAFLDDKRIACVQDENGVIFIYDLENSKIDKEIEFAGAGDYEGITIHENTAYILKSNGTIYKVENFESQPKTTEHKTSLTAKQDVEGLCYDALNNRLLLAIKDKEPHTANYKGIYAVDISTMEMVEDPVFKLKFDDPIFGEIDEKKSHNKFMPSEININPETGEVYVLAASTPMFLFLDAEGNPQKLLFLNKKDFPQPEGITFDTSGNIYISNEGNPATIHRVSFK